MTTTRRRVVLVGIGCGDPEHLTLAAVRAIAGLDVLFLVTKDRGDDDELVALRRAVVAAHRPAKSPHREVELRDPPRPWRTAPDYHNAVEGWRAARAKRWERALGNDLVPGETGVFLVWGDPSLYESTLSVVAAVRARGAVEFDLEVVPGVSSLHVLTARHRIPLNRVGGAVQLTPARRLLEAGMPDGIDDVVVVLDPGTTFRSLDPAGLDIYWGAYLGTPDEILMSGPLDEVADAIAGVRAEAKARKGWVFDTYLLRRREATA